MPRKKVTSSEEARALFYRYAADAAGVLYELMQEKDLKPELRLKVAEAILDRVCAKPGGSTAGGNDAPVTVRFEGVLEEWSR